ncbi:unnamed protein product [Echinostoma caproni]|uniref:SWIB domain-containing protein n=1 Tax=Echinostoma caproni TaxID=27848 RepID=A0A183A9U1_9TREM|nr:unnamed protein product [Echinostoma caproni]
MESAVGNKTKQPSIPLFCFTDAARFETIAVKLRLENMVVDEEYENRHLLGQENLVCKVAKFQWLIDPVIAPDVGFPSSYFGGKTPPPREGTILLVRYFVLSYYSLFCTPPRSPIHMNSQFMEFLSQFDPVLNRDVLLCIDIPHSEMVQSISDIVQLNLIQGDCKSDKTRLAWYTYLSDNVIPTFNHWLAENMNSAEISFNATRLLGVLKYNVKSASEAFLSTTYTLKITITFDFNVLFTNNLWFSDPTTTTGFSKLLNDYRITDDGGVSAQWRRSITVVLQIFELDFRFIIKKQDEEEIYREEAEDMESKQTADLRARHIVQRLYDL